MLTCGKEIHVHSTACYHSDAESETAAEDAATAGTKSSASAGAGTASTARGTANADASDGTADASSVGSAAASTGAVDGKTGRDAGENRGSTESVNAGRKVAADGSTGSDASAAATTNVMPEEVKEKLSDGYVPQLDPVDMEAVLGKNTGFYYYDASAAAENGQDIPADSSQITDWKKYKDDDVLEAADILRLYLPYTIPAGTLNSTNQIARYRLPGNIRLDDAQIVAINETENGLAGSFVNYDTLEITDPDKYEYYRGAEAVEGTRKPDQDANDYLYDLVKHGGSGEEYISAVVKAENVFDEKTGDYLGQDLIFIFTPYSIEKNQNEYDTTGKPVKAGEKITGWFACDFNCSQINWTDADDTDDADEDKTETSEKTADVVLVNENKDAGIKEISETLILADRGVDLENGQADAASTDIAVDDAAEAKTEAGAEEAADTATDADSTSSARNQESKDADQSDQTSGSAGTAEEVSTTEEDNEQPAYKSGTLTATGDSYKVTLDYTAEAKIPEEARLQVTEITAESDPEAYEACLEEARKQVVADDNDKTTVDAAATRFFDIEIVVEEEGQQKKIEPSAPVAVNIQLAEKKDTDKEEDSKGRENTGEDNKGKSNRDAASVAKSTDSAQDPTVLHFTEEGVEHIEAVTSVNETKKDVATEIQFETESFSIYGVIYTVDFEYSVNGKMYQFSLPGGGFVSFTDLVEVLGIIGDTNSEENGDENGSVSAENTDENAANEGTEENSINSVTNTVITLGDVEVSEATRKFVADVASVEFSSPELVDVSKVDAETTVGKIKENRRLECEYSAELTEEQIAEINAQTVEAGDWALISVQPFTSEETLTVTMKNGEVFTIRVTDAQIKKTVIDAKGDTWEITVTYGEDAKIPDGAELKVEEILPEDEEYVDLYNRSIEVGANTAEKQGVELPVICGTRMFDIEIHGDDGEIEPAAPVQVNIRLVGSKQETEKLSVVHFADDGAEALNNREVGTADRDSYKVAFEAESFSVYTVQNFTSLSDYLNSAEYALVSERGTGITSADGINSVSNFAMISSMNGDSLSGKGVYMDKTATPRTVGGYVTEWGFENTGNNQYYIYMMDGNTKKYVKASGNNLVMDTTGTPFTATVSDNKVRFSYNGQSITSTGNNPSRFVLANNNNNDSLFNLCKVDPNYEEKVAKKVSAADWKAAENNPGKWDENDTVIIYRRIEHEDGSEDLYAVATDGTLIPVSDGGDSIYYHCPEGKNLNWHVVLGASGYYISNVIPEGSTESTVYLAPSVTNGTWSSSSAMGLTLGGMGNTYDTTIENWDQAAYAYAGLHVDATNATTLAEGVTPGSGVTSDTFLFAVSDTLISEGQLHTVNTVDSTSKGITMKIFNYGGSTSHGGYRNDDMQSVMGDAMTSDWDNRKSHVTRTVESKLGDDGFPVSLTNGYGSYAGLFTLKDNGGVAESASDANHLFLQSYYDENGMFRYSSLENFAHFNTSGEHTGEFTVYREAGTPNIPTANDHYYYYHGHFMPYNDLDPTVSVSRIVDQYGSMEDKEMGRSYENVYGLSETPDYYVGMTLEAKFVQPSGGTLENGDPVVFRFTGDDDMLVYIDGILVLDVGGIHEPLTGSINFETGTVYQPNFYREGAGWETHTTTLYQIFRNAYNNGLISADDWAKMKWVDADGDGTYDTFADHTTHNFNMFYFERGAGASNLDIQFNLQVTKKDEFTVRKTIPEGEKSEFVNQLYKFKAYFIDDTEPDSAKKKKLLYPGATKADGSTVEKLPSSLWLARRLFMMYMRWTLMETSLSR